MYIIINILRYTLSKQKHRVHTCAYKDVVKIYLIRINIIIVCKFAFFKRANLIVASYKDNDLWIYEVASKQKGVVYRRFKLNWILELFILCKILLSWPCRCLCEFFLWWSLKPWHRIWYTVPKSLTNKL